MELLIILLIAFVVFDIIALKWGVDSTDDINSSEWERRQSWYGLTNTDTYTNRTTIPAKRASLNGHLHIH